MTRMERAGGTTGTAGTAATASDATVSGAFVGTRPAGGPRRHAPRGASEAPVQRNFLVTFGHLLDAIEHDYVDCARYRTSGYSEFMGKLYTMNPAMFQDPAYCDRTLTQMAVHYLSWFQDPAIELLVGPNAAWRVRATMRVQRYGDALYVTEATADAPARVGERIVAVNGQSLDAIRPEVERLLRTTVEPADPEREDWSVVLAFARSLTVRGTDDAERKVRVTPGDSLGARRERAMSRVRDEAAAQGRRLSNEEVVRIARERLGEAGALAAGRDGMASPDEGPLAGMVDAFALARTLASDGEARRGEGWGATGAGAERPDAEAPVWLERDGQVDVLRVRRPGDPAFPALAACAARELGAGAGPGAARGGHEADATACRGLVIDVRGAAGGALQDAYPLIGLVLDPQASARPAELFGAPGVMMNCSRGNVDERLAELDALRPVLAARSPGGASEELSALDETRGQLEARRGAGLVMDDADLFPPATLVGAPVRRSVAVLADRYTCGAAEWLVRAAKSARGSGLGHAVVMGRATAGSIDNTSPRIVRMDDDFALVIPTAKYAFALEGAATLGRGVTPDEHLPWTPAQLTRDEELDAARACVSGQARA
ncbi:MAG: S41 family peptidase [Coriobacteriales bacterium]|jgi:hypothetical protein